MLSKAFTLADYADLRDGIHLWSYGHAWCVGHDVPVYLPHPHRAWEYASVLQAIQQHVVPGSALLDVGCGHSPLGVSAALELGMSVVEIDPTPLNGRASLAEKVRARTERGYDFLPVKLQDLPPDEFDAVVSVSVMEHLPPEEQEAAWKKLASHVVHSGVLAVTVDYGQGSEWGSERERITRFGAEDIQRVSGWLSEAGVECPPPDLTYTGDLGGQFDYTFFRLFGVKR